MADRGCRFELSLQVGWYGVLMEPTDEFRVYGQVLFWTRHGILPETLLG
jgi:hypothetical protein